jgi:TrmH family RNA methyltransferase
MMIGVQPPLRLTSLDNPRLKRVVHLRKQRNRRDEGVFVAEGFREVGRALDAGLDLLELFWSPEQTRLSHAELLKRLPALAHSQARLIDLPPALLVKIAYLDEPEGILGVFRKPRWSLEDLDADPTRPASRPPLYLIANGTNKPGNLGAMARTAAAAGVTALFAADADVDAFNPNAIRASTGAVFTLPIVSASSQELIQFLRDRSVPIFAATPDATTAYTDADFTKPAAIVIGAEDTGVTPPWAAAARALITIPMAHSLVDSLNASNSAAILLFEALRQRGIRMKDEG